MAINSFDDELDDVKPQQTAKPTAQAAAAAAPAQAATPAASTAKQPPTPPAPPKQVASDDFDEDEPKKTASAEDDDADSDCDTDFDDEKLYSRPNALPRCRPEKDKAARFAFVGGVKMKTAKSHFVEIGQGKETKKGTYRCLSKVGSDEQGWCCDKLKEDGAVHVAALVVRYTNANPVTGKYDPIIDAAGNKTAPPIAWELQFVDLSQFNMKQIKKLPDEDATPYDIDIIMTRSDRAFGYEFNRAAAQARWKKNPELVKEVNEAVEKLMKDNGKRLEAKLGKKLDLLGWKALLSGAKVHEEPKIDNIDDI
jgi:hypothetical protein